MIRPKYTTPQLQGRFEMFFRLVVGGEPPVGAADGGVNLRLNFRLIAKLFPKKAVTRAKEEVRKADEQVTKRESKP